MRSLRSRRPDPSPSRWAYRMNRLWLTPGFHQFLRRGLPLAAVVGLGVWYFGDGQRLRVLGDLAYEAKRSFEERPEFMVHMLAIDGASPYLAQAVRDRMPINLPLSSFDLDLAEIKAVVESLDAVEGADLVVRSGGILNIAISERRPAVLWRHGAELMLLDETGHRVALASERGGFPELPVMAGTGADRAVPEALALIAAARPVADRVRGLERIGERRWDLVLDRDQRILLPEAAAVTTLDRLMALHQADELLDRDIALVDLRTPHRPTLRLTSTALAELIRIRNFDAQGASE